MVCDWCFGLVEELLWCFCLDGGLAVCSYADGCGLGVLLLGGLGFPVVSLCGVI